VSGLAPSAADVGGPTGRRYLPIESHGVIGDLQTAALVGIDGTIDFWCLPRFDGPTVFASLLDARGGGSFEVRPALDGVRHTQLYLPDTNVLLTRFLAPDGVAEISDFMPVPAEPAPSRIVRRVKAVRGDIAFRLRCAPRFDYARAAHELRPVEGGVLFVPRGPAAAGPALRLTTPLPLAADGGDAVAEFTLRRGESVPIVLESLDPGVPAPPPPSLAEHGAIARTFKETVNFWRDWIGRSTYQGRWRDQVHRSALVLKLMHSRRSGAIVAAPTFGLPEAVGGVRNWDYRYTWIRDAAFTTYGLIRLGLTGETRSFIDWLAHQAERNAGGGGGVAPLQTMYAIDGGTEIPEWTLDHLEGYRGSRPVRVGNAASGQLQLDIYGELIDSLYLYDKYAEPTSYDLWRRIAQLVDWVCEHWALPDEGVWEVRSGRRHFLYSRVLCWVAVDRGIRLAVKRSLPAPIARWHEVKDAIYREVFERFWDDGLRAFVSERGTRRVDASCLVMPLMRFISPTDPRWLSTLRAVERELVEDSLVFRYRRDGPATDGLPGDEGTFSLCSFWYIECLSRAGDLQQARFLLEKMFGYANHLGLYAEQIGPSGEHLGNFPQAFTHLALISAAFDLDRRLSGAGWTA